MKLDQLDRELLDFFCACAHHRVRVTRVKAPRRASLRRLRFAGLVGLENFEPSASSIAHWRERLAAKPIEIPAEAPGPEDPPQPEAGAKGDAANARPHRAASPSRKKPKISRPKRARLGASAAEPPQSPAPAPRSLQISDAELARLPDPLVAQLSRPARARAARRDPTAAPPSGFSPDKTDFLRGLSAMRRTNRKKAEAFLDSGKTSGDAPGVSLRIEARKVEIQRAEEARLADPIEQAKTLIRRLKGVAVFGAEVSGGLKGTFYVGQRLLSEPELLAYAGKLKARASFGLNGAPA